MMLFSETKTIKYFLDPRPPFNISDIFYTNETTRTFNARATHIKYANRFKIIIKDVINTRFQY